MTQEDRDLLVKDLCSRLPYGVKIQYEGDIFTIDHISAAYEKVKLDTPNNYTIDILEIKPYLLPLESMTEDQKKELADMYWSFNDSEINNIIEYLGNHRQIVTHFDCFTLIEWCYKNHFDINGLIPMDAAVNATGLNIY